MCIAIAKPLGKKLDQSVYRNCFSNNDDGAGFAYVKDGELFTAKGFFTFKDFWDHFAPLEEYAGLIHFRVGTSGGMNGENCHPWRVLDKREGDPIDLAFIHNGVISITRRNQSLSDTGNFNEEVLKNLGRAYPDFWKQKEFKWMLENAIGSGNKLALMDDKGHTEIFNEAAGKWDNDCWFSNNTFSYCSGKMARSAYSTGHPYTCGEYDSDLTSGHQWHDDGDTTENYRFSEKVKSKTVQRLDETLVNEGDFVGIDTASIDARLEAAEQKRLAKK